MNVFRNKKVAVIAASILLVVIVGWWKFPLGKAAKIPPQNSATVLTVNVVQPKKIEWPDTVQADGNLTAWQEAVIGAETGSLRITEIFADVGSEVKHGQLLARLSDAGAIADVNKQIATVAQARAALEKAQSDFQRATKAANSGALSEQTIEGYRITEETDRAALQSTEADLQSKRITLAQTRVVAVDDGVISSRSALLGNVVSAGTELFRLLRQDRIEWQAEINAQQLKKVKTGQLAQVRLPSGEMVLGKVRMVAPTLSTNTGRGIVYVSLSAHSGAQAGMFANGDITLSSSPALVIPESALVLRDGRNAVFILNLNGSRVTRRIVITGRRQEGAVEIVSGLDANARVVVSGGAFLSEGALVKLLAQSPSVQGIK